jgi:hypothetical protein
MIVMPSMAAAQEAAWHGILDLYEKHPTGWTLIGGQLVHLLCAERRYSPRRATADADTVVNARVPEVLGRVTSALIDLEFDPGKPSADGIQHRWTRGAAVIDVLIPEGTGENTEKKQGASGFPTIAAPGGTQALNRSQVVKVQIGDRIGSVARPPLLSAMIMKAAARLETSGSARERHSHDFAALASMLAAQDMVAFELTRKDRQRLRQMISRTREVPAAMEQNPNADRRLIRLAEIVG